MRRERELAQATGGRRGAEEGGGGLGGVSGGVGAASVRELSAAERAGAN